MLPLESTAATPAPGSGFPSLVTMPLAGSSDDNLGRWKSSAGAVVSSEAGR